MAPKGRKSKKMKPQADEEMSGEDSLSGNSAEDAELPVVHHKKFGEIRVDGVEVGEEETSEKATLDNGCDKSPLDESLTNSEMNLENTELGKQFLNSTVQENTENFMTALQEMESLSITLLPKNLETMSDAGTNETQSVNDEDEDSAAVENKDDVKGKEIEEEISTIRRSTRIKHNSILKQKERCAAGSEVEKPVKMKSRWRRSSEMELHSVPVPEAEPETADQLEERLQRERRDIADGMALFTNLLDNEYHCQRVQADDSMTCDCVLSKEEIESGQMGCGDDCLNRMLFIECCPQCALGDNCSNKNFQRKNYAPVQIFKTEKKGFGLKALKSFPKDTFIMEYVGEVLDQREFNKRAKSYAKGDVKHFYFMSLQGDTIIDATSKGNISRFINHSCNPNASTHKWMVNGSLRIGFFSIRNVQAGEEITFDYKFDVYGKSAQQCFCGADNCRGWIGKNADEDESEVDESEDEEEEEEEESEESEAEEEVSEEAIQVEQPKKEEKPKAKRGRKPKPKDNIVNIERLKRKKEESLVEDLGVEEELLKLEVTGLKNRAHTLTLSRLMVRADDWPTRSRLLDLIKGGDEPCRRLFLDYRGLRFLHAWMLSTSSETNDASIAAQRQIEILKTLETLPIPNKTMLIDSKILALLEEWGKKEEAVTEPEIADAPVEIKDGIKEDSAVEESSTKAPNAEVISLAKKLSEMWAALKEVFKIPKKERMEQMKEHEREADRGYRQLAKDQLNHLYSRYKLDRDRDGDRYRERDRDRDRDWDRWTNDRKRQRDSPSAADPDWLKKHQDRRNLTKQQRRQLFTMQVLREDEAARQRMQHEELWNQHQARCLALGVDPHHSHAIDPISGCPIFFNPQTRTWSQYQYPYHQAQRFGMPGYSEHSNGLTVPPVHYPPNVYMNGLYPASTASQNIISLTNASPTFQNAEDVEQASPPKLSTDDPVLTSSPLDMPIKLPPNWSKARDPRGYVYFYDKQLRISQWEPPQWTDEQILAEAVKSVDADDESSSESSETDSDNGDDEDDDEEEEVEDDEPEMTVINETEEVENVNEDASPPVDEAIESESPLVKSPIADPRLRDTQSLPIKKQIDVEEVPKKKQLSSPPPHAGKTNKKRKGLVQERIISPNYESNRSAFKRMKEKIRRRKEHRRKVKTESASKDKNERKKKQKNDTATAVVDKALEKKIKETFKHEVAADIVGVLNRYRKPDCPTGRITSHDDFKFLAKRLTHFVMVKELRNCAVGDLTCNDSVKLKAKDFVKKYMTKFGELYERERD